MNRNQIITVKSVASSFPGLISMYQVLRLIGDPKSRQGFSDLLRIRSIIGIFFLAIAWKLDAFFDFRRQLRQVVEGQATIRDKDESFKWLLFFFAKHPKYEKSPRNVEVVTKVLGKANKKARVGLTLGKDRTEASLNGPLDVQAAVPVLTDHQLQKVGENKDFSEEEVQVLFQPAPNVSMHYLIQGTHFWAQRCRHTTPEGRITEWIVLKYYTLRADPITPLVEEARKLYKAHHEVVAKKLAIYRLNENGYWKEPKYTAKRKLDTLHLPGCLKDDISKDARDFFSPLEGLQKYADRCIPYRRGYLFYGPPGCGKSSLCKALASEYCDAIFILDLGSAHLDDDKFLQAMATLPPRCVVLIEDIDAAFVKREEGPIPSTDGSVSSQMAPRKSGLSFSALLNGLDGVDAVEGRLLCITTNHVEKLDGALIRPGRVDRMIEVKYAAPDQAKELFIRWFKPRTGVNLAQLEQIQEQAEVFSRGIPDDKISVAALQGYLISCNDDAQMAVGRVKDWIEKELKRCQKNAYNTRGSIATSVTYMNQDPQISSGPLD